MVRPSLPRPSRDSAAPRAGAVVGLAVLAALMLGGCASEAVFPTLIPVPPAPDAPLFASDEEALAAAHETYTEYLAAGDRASDKDESARAQFFALSTGSALLEAQESAEMFDGKGWTRVGVIGFDSMTVQSFGPTSDGLEIRTYLCMDVSDADVVGVTAKSVAKSDRPLRLPLEVAFLETPEGGSFLVAESTVWSGSDFC